MSIHSNATRTACLAMLAIVSALPSGMAQTQTPRVTDSVTVTADRGLAGLTDAATSIVVLDTKQLQATPGLSLDDSLHAVAGFQLFRRTSSWTANPTSEGISLRGLGSTAASRTLVVSDEVPLNDAFGGWVHWNETPTLAVQQVELLRGGSSNLYGSSAIGGVIDVIPVKAGQDDHFRADLNMLGATENTGMGDTLVSGTSQRFGSALGAVTVLSTGGYIPTAPAFRGLVDIPSNVANEAVRLELRTAPFAHGATAFLRGNLLNEERSNGTPLQTNAARLWRYIAGADWAHAESTATLRLYGSREGYRQAFSSVLSVNTQRDSERLTKLQRVPTDELGLVAQASHACAHSLTAAAGFDVRDIRATDAETTPSTNVTVNSSARQRETGGFVEALWQPHGWSLSASIRADSFRTFDAQQTTTGTLVITPLPEIDELVANPRVGVVRNLSHGVALTATAFRAFRGPTLNELYRTSQVGQQLTLANNSLLAERATGFEAGAEIVNQRAGRLRATYFWTEVNRPISSVLLSQTPTSQTLQRQNLGQIRSRGVMVEAQSNAWHGLDAAFGYQFAEATVTAFRTDAPLQPDLLSKWIPEVPRESVTAALNYRATRVAVFHLLASYQGQEFDDTLNQSRLHPYARFDLSAERSLGHKLSLYAGAQNLFNRQIDAGLTPLLTQAPPRLVQGGLRYSFAE